jgi:nitrate reductase cytochrome c-type subunit
MSARTAMLAAAVLAGGVAAEMPPVRRNGYGSRRGPELRAEREAERARGAAERIAKAEAKRQRKAARRAAQVAP